MAELDGHSGEGRGGLTEGTNESSWVGGGMWDDYASARHSREERQIGGNWMDLDGMLEGGLGWNGQKEVKLAYRGVGEEL